MTHRCVYILALAAAAPFAALCGAQDIELAPPLVLEHLGLSLRFPAAGVFEACQGKRVLRHAFGEGGAPTRTIELFIVSAITERGAPIPIEECLRAAVGEVAAGQTRAGNELRELGASAAAVAGAEGRRTLFEVRREGAPRGAGAVIVWPCGFPRAGAEPRPYYLALLLRGRDAPAVIENLAGRMIPAIARVPPRSPEAAALPPLRIAKEYKDYGMALDLPLGWSLKELPPSEPSAPFELTVAAYDYAEVAAPQRFTVGVKAHTGGSDLFDSPERVEAFVRGIDAVAAIQRKKLLSHRVIAHAGRACLEVVLALPQDSRERIEVQRLLRSGAWQYSLTLVQTSADQDAARARLDAFAGGFRLIAK